MSVPYAPEKFFDMVGMSKLKATLLDKIKRGLNEFQDADDERFGQWMLASGTFGDEQAV